MKTAVKFFSAVLVLGWLFVMGTQLGTFNAQRQIKKNTPTVTEKPSAVTTGGVTAVAGTVPYKPETTTEENPSEEEPMTETTPTESTGPTQENTNKFDKAKVAELFNAAMNKSKTEKRTCEVTTVSTVNIQLTDCSVPSAINAINSIVDRFTADNKEEKLLFTDGVSEDGLTILSQLPPMGKETSLTADGIAEYTLEEKDGGYVISMRIVPETATLEQPPVHHSSSIGYLDAASLDLPATITKADMNYPGAQIVICTNADGLMTSYEREYPMSGSGAAKIGPFTGSASFEGSLQDKWSFDWK